MSKNTSLKVKNTTQSLIGSKGGASTMAELMAKQTKAFVSLKKGESVKARITKLTSSEILVDAGAKTEAHVMEKDKRILNTILSMFKVGDTVDVNVLNPESEYGFPVVSLRRFLGNRAWTQLEELQKNKDQIEVTVKDVTKAGFVVDTDFGVSGFLPQSHTSEQGIVSGQRLKVTVLELLRKDNKVIFSQKATMSDEDFSAVTKQFKVGDKVDVIVGNVTSFGVFVTLPLPKPTAKTVSVEGFLHISEAAWDKVDDLSETFVTGQKAEMVITRFDTDTRKINLSVKRLSADPFEELLTQFPVDKKVTGTVIKVEDAGVTLDLEELEGFIKKDKVPAGTTYAVGQEITATVSEHDKRRHRLLLTPVLKEKPLMYR